MGPGKGKMKGKVKGKTPQLPTMPHQPAPSMKGNVKGKTAQLPTMPQQPAPSVKGQVKGKVPQGQPAPSVPPPPPMVKGKGKGPPPMTAKGKGKLHPIVKAKMKAKAQAQIVPEHLQAPQGANRLRPPRRLESTVGTLWEGLKPWEADHSVCVIDLDRLREQWLTPAVPAVPTQAQTIHRGTLLSRYAAQSVGIAMLSLGLNPGLVDQALTQDFSVLSPAQAEGLVNLVVPHTEEQGQLQVAVQINGVQGLSPAEQLVWAVASVPQGPARARLLALQHTMPGEVAHAEFQAGVAERLPERLRSSWGLRSVLQALLVIRNILSQQDCRAFPVEALATLDIERVRHVASRFNPQTQTFTPGGQDRAWFQDNCPTTLRLVAECMVNTHARRCQLRLLRMLSVGRLCRQNHVRQQVWAYLDDLQSSVMDVFTTLQDSRSDMLCAALVADFQRYTTHLRVAQREVHALQAEIGAHPVMGRSQLSEQVAELGVRITEATNAVHGAVVRIEGATADVCALTGAGTGRGLQDKFRGAREALAGLRHFGRILQQEVELVLFVRGRAARTRQQDQGAVSDLALRRARPWKPVDTRAEVLCTTKDPNLIRRLRSELGSVQSSQKASSAAEQEVEVEATKDSGAGSTSAVSLVHGGVEGAYRRDPITGKWGRTAEAAAAVAAEISIQTLLHTADPNLARTLRGNAGGATAVPSNDSFNGMSYREAQRLKAAQAEAEVQAAAAAELEAVAHGGPTLSAAHGGAVGHYHRDPLTGGWGTRRYA